MTAQDDDRSVALAGGARIPLLGFGTWQLSGRHGVEAVSTALEVGYRHVDTATGYGNETQVGEAMRASGVPREEVFITTKLPPDHAGRERETLERSLEDLGVDNVDLWLVHWPPGGEAGVDTWRQFVALRDEGLARAIGVSNYSTAQVDELVAATGVTPEVNQVEWGPFAADRSLAADMERRGVVLEGYSPFKSSDLQHPVLREVADAHGRTPAQVVLAWHLAHRVVCIPKSADPERIRTNYAALDISLDAEEVERIDALAG